MQWTSPPPHVIQAPIDKALLSFKFSFYGFFYVEMFDRYLIFGIYLVTGHLNIWLVEAFFETLRSRPQLGFFSQEYFSFLSGPLNLQFCLFPAAGEFQFKFCDGILGPPIVFFGSCDHSVGGTGQILVVACLVDSDVVVQDLLFSRSFSYVIDYAHNELLGISII